MNQYLKPKYLPGLSLVLGVLGCVCASWLWSDVDDRGLLNPSHPGAVLIWIITVLAVAAAVVLTHPLTGKARYKRLFPRSTIGAVGTALCAVALAITGYGELTSATDRIFTACGVMGILSGVALLHPAWRRFTGKRPHFLPRCLLIVYLMMHMLCRYQVWSAEPELLRYFFELCATALLSLGCYQRAALDVGIGSRRMYTLMTMLGVFFALVAIPGSKDVLFLSGMSVWAICDRCNLNPRKPRKEQEAG